MPDVSGAFKAFIKTYADMKPDEERVKLMELRRQVMELEDENLELERENKMLRERLAERKKLEHRGGAYFILDDDGTSTGPVCPKCYIEDGFVSLLAQSSIGSRCYVCKSEFPGVKSLVDGRRQRLG